MISAELTELRQAKIDLQEVIDDSHRLTRELDVAMHGEVNAAKQASLCDLIAPAEQLRQVKESKVWLVWSNEHQAWWGPNRSGYFIDINSAGRYTLAEAVSCAETRSPAEIPPEVVVPAPEIIRALLLERGIK